MNRWFDNLPLIGNKIPGKITLSFLMLIFAIVMAILFRSVDRSICTWAMLFSFAGDVALNHNPNHNKQTKKDFIVGGIAFIFAHMFYCITYYTKINAMRYNLINTGFIFAVIILIVITGVFIVKIYFQRTTHNERLFGFGIMYLWLTGINYTTIFSYAVSEGSIKSLAAFGGLLFLASDVIIGAEKFLGLESKLARELVWWLYPIGQIILIAMA